MRTKNYVQTLVQSALIAAVYVVLTTFLPLQHEGIQFRIAEVFTLLCFYNKKYIPALILACFAANLIGSPFGPIDWVLGTAATALAVIFMPKVKNIWLAGMLPVITNAIIVGAMLTYFSGFEIYSDFGLSPSFILNAAFVALGQFVVIVLVGVPMFKFGFERNKKFMDILRS